MDWTYGFSLVETIGILGALVFTAFEHRKLRKEIRIQAHNRTIDRMYQIRSMLIADPDLYHIWDGGIEGDALQGRNHKYFYITKMLLHMNESLYCEMRQRGASMNETSSAFGPWRENLKTDLTAPHFREVWTNNRIVRESYDPEFRAQVNDIIDEIERGDVKPNDDPVRL